MRSVGWPRPTWVLLAVLWPLSGCLAGSSPTCPGGVLVGGECLPHDCADRICPDGFVCRQEVCQELACLDVPCQTGEACAGGLCYPRDCATRNCPGLGEVCLQEQCTTASCVGVECPPGQLCASGLCYPEDCQSFSCPGFGEVCVEGGCRERTCVGVTCPAAQVCAGGYCYPETCADTGCAGADEICVDEICVARLCAHVVCGEGLHCVDGWCVPVCTLDADGDGYPASACGGPDCDDGAADVHPGQVEGPFGGVRCANGLDDDCDGRSDERQPACCCPPEGREIVYQQGVGGYAGLADTFIGSYAPTENNGISDYLVVRSYGLSAILLRFELDGLVPGVTVEDARLELTVSGRSNAQGMRAEVYRVLRDWREGEATWEQAAAGVPWEEVGCAGAGVDRAAAAEDTVLVDALDVTYGWSLTGMVQAWVDDPAGNFGVVLAGADYEGAVEYVFFSADAQVDPALEPRLIVRCAAP